MKQVLKLIVWICKLAVGGLFIFSGLIKANDPLGFSYKLEEYFETFAGIFVEHGLSFLATPMEWMAYIAIPLSMFIVVLEIVLGILTILGVKMRQVATWLLLLIVFFTILTFVSWNWDLVKTCGCFGDFWVLTPLESFLKDIYLLAGILILFFTRNTVHSILTPIGDKLAIASSSIIFFLFTFYAYNHLPFADHRAYAIGNSLLEKMSIEKGNPLTLYKLEHKINGAIAEMAIYPDDYQNWKPYIDPTDSTNPYFKNVEGNLNIKYIKVKSTGQKNRVLEIPSEMKSDWELINDTSITFVSDIDPKIQDLTAYSFDNDEDKIETMLTDSNFRFVMVIRDLSFFGEFVQTNDGVTFMKSTKGEEIYKRFQDLYKLNKMQTFYFSVLTSEYDNQKIQAFKHEMNTKVKFYNCDDKELKTMIRATPGLFLWKKDLVLGKWHHFDFPSTDDINEEFLN